MLIEMAKNTTICEKGVRMVSCFRFYGKLGLTEAYKGLHDGVYIKTNNNLYKNSRGC